MIEPVTPAEAEEVARFIEHVIDTSVDATPQEKQFFVRNVNRNLARWRDAPERAVHLKAVVDGALAGVVMVKDRWYLCHLFVAPSRQRHGVGRALVEAAVALCRAEPSRPSIRLVASRNSAGFYARMGFTPVHDGSAGDLGTPFELRL